MKTTMLYAYGRKNLKRNALGELTMALDIVDFRPLDTTEESHIGIKPSESDLVEAARIELASKTVAPSTTTSVSPVSFSAATSPGVG